MVGKSTDWKVGLKASIKKWEQLVRGDNFYDYDCKCGLCFVKNNRDCYCADCPAVLICDAMNENNLTPSEVLAMLHELTIT